MFTYVGMHEHCARVSLAASKVEQKIVMNRSVFLIVWKPTFIIIPRLLAESFLN